MVRLFGRRAAASRYGVAYLKHNIPDPSPGQDGARRSHSARKHGAKGLAAAPPEGNCVDLVVLCDAEVWATHHLPRAVVHPGERVTIHFPLRVPAAAGSYFLKLDLVEQGVTRFEDQGVRPLTLTLRVDAPLRPRAA